MLKPFLTVALLALLTSCATGQPSAFERQAYYVTTNWVPRVSQQIQVSSNMIGTNAVLVITNIVLLTNMVGEPHFEPRESVKAVIQTGGTVATGLGLIWAVPVFGLLAGLYGWWAEFRNSQKKKAIVALVQNVETGREVIKAMPGGAEKDEKFKAQIISQQVTAGVRPIVREVVDNTVNNVAAVSAAEKVVNV